MIKDNEVGKNDCKMIASIRDKLVQRTIPDITTNERLHVITTLFM